MAFYDVVSVTAVTIALALCCQPVGAASPASPGYMGYFPDAELIRLPSLATDGDLVAGGLRPLRDQLRVKAVYLLPFF